MRSLSTLFIITLCTCATHSAFGVQSQLSHSNLSGLITQPVITAIYRDRFGFLWIGTQEGLYKFDGTTHTVFNSDKTNRNRIPVSEIRGITEDPDGKLLVATYGGGLLEWDRTSSTFTSKVHPYSSIDYIVHLYVSEHGNIWLGTQDRLVLYNSVAKSTDLWLATEDLVDAIGRPYALLEDKSGRLFVGSATGLTGVSTENMKIIRYDLSSLKIQEIFGVTALALDASGNLFIGTDTGHIAMVDSESGAIQSRIHVAIDTPLLISSIVLYDDKLVIGTDKGLYSSDRNLSYIEDISARGSGLSNSDIHSLTLDDNQVWVGTYNGLDLLTLAPFEMLNRDNSGVDNEPLTFAQDDDDRIWVGTYDGLYIYADKPGNHLKFEDYFETNRLKDQRISVLERVGDQIWLGYLQGGIQIIDIRTGGISLPRIADASEAIVMDIQVDSESENIWIATKNRGLIRVTPQKTFYYRHSGSLNEKAITKLSYRNGRLLLVAASNRIYEYDRENDSFAWLKIDFGFGIEKTTVLSLSEDESRNILLGTKDHGIYKWEHLDQETDNSRALQLGEGSIVQFATIYAIETDTHGNIWCSTQNGIVKLDPEGRLLKRFTTADGLQGHDFTLGASFKSRQGLIYFGGTNGYNRFDPDKIEIDSDPTPMRLTDISLPSLDDRDFGDVSDLASLQLTHVDRYVTFQFSVLDFIDPERNQFRYKLENFDSDWIENGNGNTATYTNLPAGDYIFRAQGANSAGIWNLEGIELDVTVIPAPWRTWWAYTFYCLALLCLAWGTVRIYRSYAIDRESTQLAQEMFEAENRADDDMHEQLEFQDELVRSAYQHNLTTLELVSDSIRLRGSAQKGLVKRDLADSTLERISALFGLEDCLSYQAGGPMVNLYQYTEGIFPGLLDRSPVSPETVVTINEVTTMEIPAELASPISVVIYELLDNCIQHAFPKDSPANYIHIRLISVLTQEPNSQHYELTVHDSGTGVPDTIENLSLKGRGLAIVQFIANKLCGKLESIEGSGTTIRLTIPDVDTPERTDIVPSPT